MWIHTNHGLDRFNRSTVALSSYPQFNGQEKIGLADNGDLLVLGTDDKLYYLPAGSDSDFIEVDNGVMPYNSTTFISLKGDTLLSFGDDGVVAHGFKVSDGVPALSGRTVLSDAAVGVAHVDGDGVLYTGTDGIIRRVEADGNVTDLIDIRSEIDRRGSVSDLLCDMRGDIYVSFVSDGVIRARKTQTGSYRIVDSGLKSGVFRLEKSSTQPVVWIGTDCQGLYTCYDSPYMLRSYDFSFFDKKINHPVRAVYLDKENTLWIGTKGGGVLKVPEFSGSMSTPSQMELFTVSNSALGNNSVFVIEPSSRPLLWIGTDGGLNYYSYKEKRIKPISDEPVLRYIYGIHEENDSTLWVSSVGNGVVRCRLSGSPDNPRLDIIKVYSVDGGTRTSNFFFDMAADSQGKLLFANRGLGAFVIEGDSLVRVPIQGNYDTNSVLDVFSVVHEDAAKWLGT